MNKQTYDAIQQLSPDAQQIAILLCMLEQARADMQYQRLRIEKLTDLYLMGEGAFKPKQR